MPVQIVSFGGLGEGITSLRNSSRDASLKPLTSLLLAIPQDRPPSEKI